MTVIANQVTRLLFSNIDSLDELSHEQLSKLAEQYPYFTPLHFLQAVKEKDTQATDTAVYNKALLHIPHALQLDYLLNGGGDVTITKPVTSTPAAVTMEEPVAEVVLPEETELPETILPEAAPEPVTAAPVMNEPIAETIIPVPETVPDVTAKPVITLPDTEHFDEDEEPLPEDEGGDDNHEIIIPGLKIEAIDPKTAELSLTPTHFHTVDYFASLGIKFREQDKPVEKFDRQLKSFTDWLKIIKKVPDNQPYKANDAKAEQKVEEMAGLSLKNDKIITETMAEVWAKQGNTAKAIEVYQKLSLLDPAKSAYFASRIENLKKSN